MKIIIKFLFDDSPQGFFYIIIKITSSYISRDELSALRKHHIIKSNARKLFLNNALVSIAIVLSVYTLISAVIGKGSINYQTFNCTLVCIVILTLLIWIWALYTHYLVEKWIKRFLL